MSPNKDKQGILRRTFPRQLLPLGKGMKSIATKVNGLLLGDVVN